MDVEKKDTNSYKSYLKCNFCDYKTSSLLSWAVPKKAHVDSIHLRSRYQCELCEKQFARKIKVRSFLVSFVEIHLLGEKL